MSYVVRNFIDNDDVEIIDERGMFQIVQYIRDLSCTVHEAQTKYFMSMMNVTKKQIVVNLDEERVILQQGMLQWMVGNIVMTSGFKGAGDVVKKAFTAKVTGESVTKPEYSGTGVVVTEPTYKYYIIEDLNDWNGSMVVEDGLFCAAEGSVNLAVQMRDNVSSAALGREGLFNLCLKGRGFVVLETRVPREELIIVDLQKDTLKVDGSYAIAWSSSLRFTVEKSGKSLMGSAVSGEGLVNVYSGTGKVLLMPQA